MKIATYRRMTKAFIIFLVLGLPILSAYMKIMHTVPMQYFGYLLDINTLEPENLEGLNNTPFWTLIMVMDKIVAQFFEQPHEFFPYLQYFKGAPWTVTLFGITFSDPLAYTSVVLAAREMVWPFLINTLIPLIMIIFLGRIFCGWLCPMRIVFQATDYLRLQLAKYGLKLPDYQFSRNWKYLFLMVGLFLAAAGIPIFHYLATYSILGREVFSYIYYGYVTIAIYFLVSVVLFELLVSRRGWCRYVCPSGAFFGLLGKYKSLSIVKDEKKCIPTCTRCYRVCELGLGHKEARIELECDNCGVCIEACPTKALEYQFKPPFGEKNTNLETLTGKKY